LFIDARSLSSGTTIETDICVVGAGAAGIALAHEFLDASYRVCVLAGGGMTSENDSQALYRGECTGLDYELDTTRARGFGGSTAWWAGFCRPLEASHFEPRDWVPHSGWPLRRRQLDAYYARAHRLCGLDPRDYDLDRAAARFRRENPQTWPDQRNGLVAKLAQVVTTQRRFGKAFEQVLASSSNVRVYLFAHATHIAAAPTASSVRHVEAATFSGDRFLVKAKLFVLASGAIENARLLLASNDVATAGLGNQHDLVGRYFMEHPKFIAGTFSPNGEGSPRDLYNSAFAVLNLPFSLELAPSEAALQEHRLLDSAIYLVTTYRGAYSPGTEAFKNICEQAWRRQFKPRCLRDAATTFAYPGGLALFLLGWLTRASWLVAHHRIHIHLEQSPNPDSRVLLGSDRDRLGLPLARLDWRLTELDRYSVQRALEMLKWQAATTGWGQVSLQLTSDDGDIFSRPGWTWHHIGTTRMHADPTQGVVDADCRVHGIDNLFVAGSSVFPTAGNHCPTFTLIALALRLADHLKGALPKRLNDLAIGPGAAPDGQVFRAIPSG
jgi:choline dehydrogenase-like flavoprotein